MNNLFGGDPKIVLLKLIAVSVVVGVILATFGLDPYRLLYSLERLFNFITYNIRDIFETLWRYFLLGAAVVVPLWLLSRLFANKPPKINPPE
jgi:hypothetical protein